MESSECYRQLRYLIATHSLSEVHSTLEQICRDDYGFLKELFCAEFVFPQLPSLPSVSPSLPSPEVKPLPLPSPPFAAQTQTQEQQTQPQEEAKKSSKKMVVAVAKENGQPTPPKMRRDIKVRIVKREEVAQAEAEAEGEAEAQEGSQKSYPDAKDVKKWQKEQEDIKARELDSKGINPASLLTKENMKKWIVDEKKTFAYIAREYVGLSDATIASTAKSMGLQSDYSKRRAQIVASKAKSKK